MKRQLTEAMIERLRAPKTGRLEVADALCPGLMLRVTPRGVKSFSVAYKVPGEGGKSSTGRPLVGCQHRITLGTWPMLRLKAARAEAFGYMGAVSEGHDPREELRDQHLIRHTNTVEAVMRRFIEKDAKRNIASWRRIERCLALHVLPVLGNRPIRDIGRGDLHDLLDGMVEDEGAGVGAAREVRKHLHRLFDFALDREIVDSNPAHKLKRKELKRNKDARRDLTDEELRAIWTAAGSLGYPFGPWVKLLMLTGQRRGDWANAGRPEIDFDRRLLEIPAARYKSDRDHVVPLVGPVWDIIEGLPVLEGDYIFSTRGGQVPIGNFTKPKLRLNKLALGALRRDDPEAALAHYTFHDFRSTCKTRLAALGIKPEVRDAVLGHARQGMDSIYNKHDYFDEKATALGAYAEHLMEVVS